MCWNILNCVHAKDIINVDTHFLHTGNHRDRNTDTNVNVLLLAPHYWNTDCSTGVQAKPFYLLSDYWYMREQHKRKQTLQKQVYFLWSYFHLPWKYGCVRANLFDCCLSLKSIQALTELAVNFDRNIVMQNSF